VHRRCGAFTVPGTDVFVVAHNWSAGEALRHDELMVDTTRSSAATRRRVHAGLAAFFGGTAALLAALMWQLVGTGAVLANQLPGWIAVLVPETATGFTVATLAVAWGVWTLGAVLEPVPRRQS
jgi:hypothetical protein